MPTDKWLAHNTKMQRSIVPTFLRIVLNRNPAQKQNIKKGWTSRSAKLQLDSLRLIIYANLQCRVYQHIWHQTKFQRRLHTPVNKYFSFFLRMFTLKSRVTAKFEADEEGIKLHVWLERASVKGCLVLRTKFQVDIAWSNFKTWQHCHTNYLQRSL